MPPSSGAAVGSVAAEVAWLSAAGRLAQQREHLQPVLGLAAVAVVAPIDAVAARVESVKMVALSLLEEGHLQAPPPPPSLCLSLQELVTAMAG